MISPIVEYILSTERITISACSLHPLLIKFQTYFMQRFSSTTSMDMSLLYDVLKYYVYEKGCFICFIYLILSPYFILYHGV